jgi:predicted SAM-dependent methyltransferase
MKLNLGCGNVKLSGWINIDINPDAEVIADLRNGLPFRDASFQFVYSEHVLEHFSFPEGRILLKECYRVLADQGVLRIAMPDLDYLVLKYSSDWKNQDWLSWPGHEFIQTRGQMMNIVFSWWGHRYLYNEEDLKDQLKNAGFRDLLRMNLAESNFTELRCLETRQDSKLIMEGKKDLRIPPPV